MILRKRRWTEEDLRKAAKESISIRQILHCLKLKEAGGNYTQIQKYLKIFDIETIHFKGRGWNKGTKRPYRPITPLEEILVENSMFQSHKLKNRLFSIGLKKPLCEECGWAKKSNDGRLPLELDHINGNNHDNRLENLRILCPNCHSLKPTHRGRNRK
jgi:5-methylcytosine-specific restriction endonuclease McrA